jgi:hypothetical protein
MTTLREGNLVFDFNGAETARRLFEKGEPIPVGFCNVDFIVDYKGQRCLIEVKEPIYRELKIKRLINQTLVPQCRDSYAFLHLMAQDDRDFLYIVLIAIDDNNPITQLLGPLRDQLLSRLRQEARDPWVRRYVTDCLVLNIDEWNRKLPFPVRRGQ